MYKYNQKQRESTMAISKIKENSLASGAITESNVGSDIINAQTLNCNF